MVCQGLEILNNYTAKSLMSYPLTCDYYFYLKIMIGLFVVLTFTLFYEERKRVGRGNLISSMAVSCIAIIFLATIGSLFGIITADILILLIIFSIIILAYWILT